MNDNHHLPKNLAEAIEQSKYEKSNPTKPKTTGECLEYWDAAAFQIYLCGLASGLAYGAGDVLDKLRIGEFVPGGIGVYPREGYKTETAVFKRLMDLLTKAQSEHLIKGGVNPEIVAAFPKEVYLFNEAAFRGRESKRFIGLNALIDYEELFSFAKYLKGCSINEIVQSEFPQAVLNNIKISPALTWRDEDSEILGIYDTAEFFTPVLISSLTGIYIDADFAPLPGSEELGARIKCDPSLTAKISAYHDVEQKIKTNVETELIKVGIPQEEIKAFKGPWIIGNEDVDFYKEGRQIPAVLPIDWESIAKYAKERESIYQKTDAAFDLDI